MYTETADVAEPWWPPRIFSDVCSCLFTVCLNLACTHALSRACVWWYELGRYTSYTSKVHITYRDTLGNDRTVTWVIAIRYPIITKLPDHTQTVTLNFFVVVSDMACIGHTSQKCHAIRCLKKVMCLQSKDSLKMYAACSIHVCILSNMNIRSLTLLFNCGIYSGILLSDDFFARLSFSAFIIEVKFRFLHSENELLTEVYQNWCSFTWLFRRCQNRESVLEGSKEVIWLARFRQLFSHFHAAGKKSSLDHQKQRLHDREKGSSIYDVCNFLPLPPPSLSANCFCL